jgi:hypothetical protein
MNLRTLSVSVAVLAALCAVAWFLQRPAAPVITDLRIGQPLLATDLAVRSAQITLADQGKTVQLARQPDGSWRVASYYDLPADFKKLTGLIDSLTDAKIQRLVTSRPDRLERLDFKDSSVTLRDAGQKELWHVTLGKNADGGGRFVRFGTEQKGYLAGLNAWLDPEGKNWADPVLLNLKPDDVARLELTFTDGTSLAASRAKKEAAWTTANPPAGKRLKADRVTALLASLAPLRFTDTTAPDDANAIAARDHSRTVKLTTFDQKTFAIVLGRKPEEKKPKALSPEAKPQDKPGQNVEGSGGRAAAPVTSESAVPAAPAKPKEPEFETIPAGPVFAFVTSSDEKAPVNGWTRKRAFQIGEWAFTGLPAAAADLWEDVPKPAASPVVSPAAKPASVGKP